MLAEQPELIPSPRGRLAGPLTFGLGIFTGQAEPGGQSIHAEYCDVLDIIEAADGLGFDAAWVSEHPAARDGYFPALMPVLAAAAVRTSQLVLGAALLVPAFHHPVALAEELAVVDQLSQGRLIAGVGLGWRRREFEAAGVAFGDRLKKLLETISLLRGTWAGAAEPPHEQVAGPLRPYPLPYQPGGPPIFIPGVKEHSIRRAARLGDGMFLSRSGPSASRDPTEDTEIGRGLDWIDETRVGKDTAFPIALMLNLFASHDDPWTVIGPGVDHQFAAYARWKHEDAGLAVSPEAVADAVAAGRSLMIAGPPDFAIERLTAWATVFAKRNPVHLVLKVHYPGIGARRTIDAIKLIADEVIPSVRARFRSLTS